MLSYGNFWFLFQLFKSISIDMIWIYMYYIQHIVVCIYIIYYIYGYIYIPLGTHIYKMCLNGAWCRLDYPHIYIYMLIGLDDKSGRKPASKHNKFDNDKSIIALELRRQAFQPSLVPFPLQPDTKKVCMYACMYVCLFVCRNVHFYLHTPSNLIS